MNDKRTKSKIQQCKDIDFEGMVDAIISTPSFTTETLINFFTYYSREGPEWGQFVLPGFVFETMLGVENLKQAFADVNKKTNSRTKLTKDRFFAVFADVYSDTLYKKGERTLKLGVDIPTRYCFFSGAHSIKNRMSRDLIDKSDGELLLQQHSEWSYKVFKLKYPHKSESDYHKFMNETDRQHGSKELKRAALKGLKHFRLLTPGINYADIRYSEMKSHASYWASNESTTDGICLHNTERYKPFDFEGMVDAIISTPSFTKEFLLHQLVIFARDDSCSNLRNFKVIDSYQRMEFRVPAKYVLEDVNKKTNDMSEVNAARLTRIFPHVFSEILHYHGEEKRKFGIDIPSRFCFMFGNRCIETHISRGFIKRSDGDMLYENHKKWCQKLLLFIYCISDDPSGNLSESQCLTFYKWMDEVFQSPELSRASQKAAAHFGFLEVEGFAE